MYSAVAANKRRTWFILARFMLLIVALVYIIGMIYGNGLFFTGIALAIGVVYALIQYSTAANLFSTHPPIENRIAGLREMGPKL